METTEQQIAETKLQNTTKARERNAAVTTKEKKREERIVEKERKKQRNSEEYSDIGKYTAQARDEGEAKNKNTANIAIDVQAKADKRDLKGGKEQNEKRVSKRKRQ